MLELFISAFITFFVVIDPPRCAPIYASLTSDASAAPRRSLAIRAVAVATLILLIFSLICEDFLRTLAIRLASFCLAGGLLLFLFSLVLVFENPPEPRYIRR